jgi:hypothetical protein
VNSLEVMLVKGLPKVRLWRAVRLWVSRTNVLTEINLDLLPRDQPLQFQLDFASTKLRRALLGSYALLTSHGRQGADNCPMILPF